MSERQYPYRGSCLCGRVRYQARRFTAHMAHCHCSMCRKFHGAAFATFGEVPAADFDWISGESDLSAYRADNDTVRHFCRHCGSSLVFEASQPNPDVVEIALGTLDTPIPDRPDANIFVANRANWYTITDDLPCFAADRTQADEEE